MPVYPIENSKGETVLVQAKSAAKAYKHVNEPPEYPRPLKADDVIAKIESGATIEKAE